MWFARILLALCICLMVYLPVAGSANTSAFADAAFESTWSRTDQPIAEGVVSGSWIWGPAPLTAGLQEPYAQSLDGQRLVQYFDKSRMELTQPGSGDPASPWYVTNGLLAVELITGRMQIGDAEFEPRFPSETPVAGDQLPRNGPSYATFTLLLDQAPVRVGETVTQRLEWDGMVEEDGALAERAIQYAIYDEATGHNVAAPFWDFMRSSRTIHDNGAYVEGPLFPHPYYATGRAITEPYWSEVVVAGTAQLVLLQCFERRCLTYTPANPAAWQVEASNIGQHYHAWRYGRSTAPGMLLFGRDRDIYTVHADGSELRNLTAELAPAATQPVWSPDGLRIAFIAGDSDIHDAGALFVMQADGTGLRQVSDGPLDSAPAWSPDGLWIAFERWLRGEPTVRFDVEVQIFAVNVDDGELRQLTAIPPEKNFSISQSPAWSPDGQWLAFSNINGAPGPRPSDSAIYRVRADGSELTALAETKGDGEPRWSPDSERIAFEQRRGGSSDFEGALLWVVNADGSGKLQLAGGAEADPGYPAWSPHGERIAFSQNIGRAGGFDDIYQPAGVILVNADGTDFTRLTHFGRAPAWSPDGRWLAFAVDGGLVVLDLHEYRFALIVPRGPLALLGESREQPQWRP